MKVFIKSISLFAGLVFLAACTTAGAPPVPKSFVDISPDEAGLAFLTVGSQAKGTFNHQTLFYKKVDTGEKGRIKFAQGGFANSALDFSDKSKKGKLFTLLLPEGEYEINNASVFLNQATAGTTTYSAKEDFSAKFTIKKGQATYLGEFISDTVYGKNFLGISVPAGGYFIVSNQFERDKSLLQTKELAMSPNEYTQMVPNPEEVKTIMFQSERLITK